MTTYLESLPRRVALLTSPRNPFWEDDEMDPVVEAFRDQGIVAEPTPWYEPRDWSVYDIVIQKSGTFDTFVEDGGERFRAYFAFLEDLEANGTCVINPSSIVKWVLDKRYLAELGAAGVPVVPATYADIGDEPVFPDCKFVVKPVRGGGALGVAAYEAHQQAAAATHVAELHRRGQVAMVQPYVDSLDDPSVGERALVFLDGELNHAIQKEAVIKVGEDPFLQREDDHPNPKEITPSAEDVAVTHLVLENLPVAKPLFVVRIDLVTFDGQSCVAEVTAEDPVMFLDVTSSPVAQRYVSAAIAQWGRASARRQFDTRTFQSPPLD